MANSLKDKFAALLADPSPFAAEKRELIERILDREPPLPEMGVLDRVIRNGRTGGIISSVDFRITDARFPCDPPNITNAVMHPLRCREDLLDLPRSLLEEGSGRMASVAETILFTHPDEFPNERAHVLAVTGEEDQEVVELRRRTIDVPTIVAMVTSKTNLHFDSIVYYAVIIPV